jgi:hypothetical protein
MEKDTTKNSTNDEPHKGNEDLIRVLSPFLLCRWGSCPTISQLNISELVVYVFANSKHVSAFHVRLSKNPAILISSCQDLPISMKTT